MDLVLPITEPSPEWAMPAARLRFEALAGGRFLLPNEEAGAALVRASEWNSSLKPYNAYEVFLVDQMAANGVRMEGCQHQERGLRSRNAIRAKLRWDEDRRLAAEEFGAKLSQAPARFALRLQGSAQGCDWMIDRWGRLGRILDAKGTWNPAQTALALDLLGIPVELRDGPNPLDGDTAERLEVVRAEVHRLEGLKSRGLTVLDAHERDAAEAGFGPDHDGEIAAVRRYERSCSRRFEWARGQLKAGRHGYHPEGPGTDGHRTATAPAPTFPSPPSPREAEMREQLRAIAARRAEPQQVAAASAMPPEGVVAPAPSLIVEAPPAISIASRPTSPANRLRELLKGGPTAPGNRHDRRCRAANARRNG